MRLGQKRYDVRGMRAKITNIDICASLPLRRAFYDILNYSETRGDREKRISNVDSAAQNWLGPPTFVPITKCLFNDHYFRKFRFFRIFDY